jgi:hypothetical protein
MIHEFKLANLPTGIALTLGVLARQRAKAPGACSPFRAEMTRSGWTTMVFKNGSWYSNGALEYGRTDPIVSIRGPVVSIRDFQDAGRMVGTLSRLGLIDKPVADAFADWCRAKNIEEFDDRRAADAARTLRRLGWTLTPPAAS